MPPQQQSVSGRHAAQQINAAIQSGRWLSLVGSMWLLACSGNSYNFAVYSSTLKSVLGLSQQQLTTLGVAKDIGDNVGLLPGYLSDVLPSWAVVCCGALLNFIGYGGLWLVLSQRVTAPHYFVVCLLLCAACNGSIFFITTGIVTAQRNFPHSAGIVAGIVVGFIGLSGSIFAQIYSATVAPDTAGFLLLLAVGPAVVSLLCSLIVRPFPSPIWTLKRAMEEHQNFRLILRSCLALASFLLFAICLQSFVSLPRPATVACTLIMLLLLLLPALTALPSSTFSFPYGLGTSMGTVGVGGHPKLSGGMGGGSDHGPSPVVDVLPSIAEEDSDKSSTGGSRKSSVPSLIVGEDGTEFLGKRGSRDSESGPVEPLLVVEEEVDVVEGRRSALAQLQESEGVTLVEPLLQHQQHQQEQHYAHHHQQQQHHNHAHNHEHHQHHPQHHDRPHHNPNLQDEVVETDFLWGPTSPSSSHLGESFNAVASVLSTSAGVHDVILPLLRGSHASLALSRHGGSTAPHSRHTSRRSSFQRGSDESLSHALLDSLSQHQQRQSRHNGDVREDGHTLGTLSRDQSVEDLAISAERGHSGRFEGPEDEDEGEEEGGWGYYFGEEDESGRGMRVSVHGIPLDMEEDDSSCGSSVRVHPYFGGSTEDFQHPAVAAAPVAPSRLGRTFQDVSSSSASTPGHISELNRDHNFPPNGTDPASRTTPPTSTSLSPLSLGRAARAAADVAGRDSSTRGIGRRRRYPKLGEDHSVGQAFCTADFWLMYLALVGGLGSGLAAISNLAQIGESLGYGGDKIQLFTSLLSVWQFLGRLACGSVSEHLARSYGMPRPVAMAAALLLMIVGFLAFALAPPGALHVGSLLVGFTYGGLCTLMPVTAGELFGLGSLGVLYNTLLTAAPAGSFVLSGILVGRLYEWEAEKDMPVPPPGPAPLPTQVLERFLKNTDTHGEMKSTSLMPMGSYLAEASERRSAEASLLELSKGYSGPTNSGTVSASAAHTCHGAHCFRLIFIILSLVCAVSLLISLLLAWRTRPVYEALKEDSSEADGEPSQEHAKGGIPK